MAFTCCIALNRFCEVGRRVLISNQEKGRLCICKVPVAYATFFVCVRCGGDDGHLNLWVLFIYL